MQKFLIIIGLVFLALGLLWPFVAKIHLGRLPGDIVIEQGGFRVYLPIMTSLLISALLTFVWWMFDR